MRTYRYLKNAERWVVVIGLFFLGVTFTSQSIGLTKISMCVFGLAVVVRLLLKAKMRAMFKKTGAKNLPVDDGDYEYVFTWAVVTWTVFVVSISVAGFLYSIDVIELIGLRRSIWGLAIFIGLYTLITGVRYYKDTDRLKKAGRKEITAAELNESTKEQSQKSYLKRK